MDSIQRERYKTECVGEPLFNWRRAARVSLPFCALTLFWQSYDYCVPLMLSQHFRLGTTAYAAVMSIDNVIALLFLPFFGILSDRLTGRLGRRTPLILLGAAGGVVGLSFMRLYDARAAAGAPVFSGFLTALVFTVLFMSLFRAPSAALIADCFIRPQRTRANAILNLMGALASVAFGLVGRRLIREAGGTIDFSDCMLFVILGVAAVILLYLALVRENRYVAQTEEMNRRFGLIDEKTDPADTSRTRLSASEKRSFALILLATFFVYAAYNGFNTHYTNYLVQYLRQPASWMGPYIMEVILATLMMLPAAWVTARLGRKRSCQLGAALCVLGYSGASLVTASFPQLLYLWFFIAAVGFPLIGINLGPMVLELGKDRDSGRFMSYYYIATTAAQIVTPTLASFFINAGGFRVIGVYGGFFNLLALACCLLTRHGDVRPALSAAVDSALSDDMG
ncbi:MAG: MFS transporter [Oscillospiraceae bacterium]|nr:MFS transporter [Oscillospiraceae bacterium]